MPDWIATAAKEIEDMIGVIEGRNAIAEVIGKHWLASICDGCRGTGSEPGCQECEPCRRCRGSGESDSAA